MSRTRQRKPSQRHERPADLATIGRAYFPSDQKPRTYRVIMIEPDYVYLVTPGPREQNRINNRVWVTIRHLALPRL